MGRMTHARVNGIKEGYWSPEKKDDLVDRLAEYENLGYSPEDLRIILDAIVPETILKVMKEAH